MQPLKLSVETLPCLLAGGREGTRAGRIRSSSNHLKTRVAVTFPVSMRGLPIRDVRIHGGGGGGGVDPATQAKTHPPKTKKFPADKKEILNREPKMRGPFSVPKLFFPSSPPVPHAKH